MSLIFNILIITAKIDEVKIFLNSLIVNFNVLFISISNKLNNIIFNWRFSYV